MGSLSREEGRSSWGSMLALFVSAFVLHTGMASKEFPIKQYESGQIAVSGNHTLINSRGVIILGDLWLSKINETYGGYLVKELTTIVNSTTTLTATFKSLVTLITPSKECNESNALSVRFNFSTNAFYECKCKSLWKGSDCNKPSVVPLNDTTLASAVSSCLNEDYEYGMCTDFGLESGYGTMPYWDVSQVTQMNNTFQSRYSFKGYLHRWNVTNVKNMTRMFNYAYNFNSDISTWDVSSVVDMSYMFYNAQNFNKSLSAWNVLSVIDMKYMFYNAYKFSGDVSMWRGVAASNLQTGMFSFANTFQSAFNCTDLVKGPPNSCVSN